MLESSHASSIKYQASSVLGLACCGRMAKLLAGLLYQLIEPGIDNHAPFGDLGLFERAAAILQLHGHIPAAAARECFKLLLALRRPARNKALECALQDLRAIGIERGHREPIVRSVGGIGLLR